MQTIWFGLWGILWAVYFMLGGFDLGLGTLMPVLARSEEDRQTIRNAIGPFWNGNEVWLITAGGVTFAAFPTTYSVLFSSLYTPLLMILFALIIRAAAFEFRNESKSMVWRKLWDIGLTLGSFVPALLFGVAFANLFRGIPIDGEGVYRGNLLTLLNPYGLLGGVLFVLLFAVHGTIWLTTKSQGDLHRRAASMARKLWMVLLIVAVAFFIATAPATGLYGNYVKLPIVFVIPAGAFAALLAVRLCLARKKWWKAWFSSGVLIVFATLFGVAGLYPNLIVSSIDPKYSLTATNSSSSPLTLKIMLVVVLVFVPIVIVYQAWAYNIFKHRLTEKDLGHEGY